MYEELVERLRKTYTVCGWDDLKNAADAIEKMLSENIQLKRRIVFWDKNTFGKLRTELDRLKRERDQAVEDLNTMRKRSGWKCEACYYNDHYNRDICTGCEYNNDNNWKWRGVQEENNG